MTAAPSGPSPSAEELAALSAVFFDLHDVESILGAAAAAVPGLGPCQAEATLRFVDDAWQRSPPAQHGSFDIDQLVTGFSGDGAVEIQGRAWGWAFPVRHQGNVEGTLVVSAANRPSAGHVHLLTVLATLTGAALASLAFRRRDEKCAEELARATADLAGAQQRLRSRTRVHEAIEAALDGDEGEQAITDAVYRLTALSVVLEDQFGNIRCWSGPGRPVPYPKPNPRRRQRQLAVLATQQGPVRMNDRIAVVVRPHGEILGVLAIVDPQEQVTEDDLFALYFARTLLGYELTHQRSLVEREQAVRRELVDDLLAGTSDDGAVARAEALGHDLRRPHYVVVVHSSSGSESLVTTAASRAAEALRLDMLHGHSGRLVVLLTAGRPDPRALYQALSEILAPVTCALGVGSRCDAPSDFPQSFAAAQRALNVRLHSAAPDGASAYDELGFYRLIDAAQAGGAVEEFIREWLGTLLDYDAARKSELVFTLSEHLESGGNYDISAKTLHIHRSTLRYRLARISELTGYDLRDVDTRFNLHVATRSWRFLHAASGQ